MRLRNVSRGWPKWGLALLAAALLLAGWLAGRGTRPGPQPVRAALVAAAPPVEDVSGFARADGSRPLAFPADFGPHDDFQTEWWYYTGNLAAATGEHFAYQLTFFRRALAPPAQVAARASAWGTTQVYMAHFALSDVAGGQHYAFQRYARGAAGLAGARAGPYRVWLDDWSVSEGGDGRITLHAASGQVAVDLVLAEPGTSPDAKGPVLQGDQGYSRKGPEPGNASYYYSFTRIPSDGAIAAGGRVTKVRGLSWLDHEFSTSALGAGQVGWDWFSLQLDDGRELMVYAIRGAGGSAEGTAGGSLVAADGSVQRLRPGDFNAVSTGQWRSPHTGAVYPAGWRLSVPSAALELSLSPYLADQEMPFALAYWEGAVHASGVAAGRPISGDGFVELTGYAGSMQGRF